MHASIFIHTYFNLESLYKKKLRMLQMCKKLHQLNLCGNHLTKLPESFGELESLQFLHLGSMLEELERGDHINGNWLCDLPVSFPQLTMLTTLRLDENHLRVLPSDFGRLCNLEYLDLGMVMVLEKR